MYTVVDPFDGIDDALQIFLDDLLTGSLPKLKSEKIANRIKKAGSFPDLTTVKAAMDSGAEPKVLFKNTVSRADGATVNSSIIWLSEDLLTQGNYYKVKGIVDPNG